MKESKILKDYPDVLKQWDYELNPDVLMPDFLLAHSNKQYYWKGWCVKDVYGRDYEGRFNK
jgi:hypothetical protein